MIKIAGYLDPYELWAASEQAPQPERCAGLTNKKTQCELNAQGGLGLCQKHWPKDKQPYPKPDFIFAAAVRAKVLYEGDYIPLCEGIMMLKLQEPIPMGLVLHHIKNDEGDYPDNLQLVPGEVRDEAKKAGHPKGEPIRWKEENGVPKYNPTSVRLPTELLDYIDQEAARLGWSRNKVLEHYLVQGIKHGSKPEALADMLKASG